MRTSFDSGVINNQTIGNIGLYHTCCHLSMYGWNVMPTSRNAKGPDIVIYSQTGDIRWHIQIKTRTEKNTISLDNLLADYFIICVRVYRDGPTLDCFVLSQNDVQNSAHKCRRKGKLCYDISPKVYSRFKAQWFKIGYGMKWRTNKNAESPSPYLEHNC